MSTHLHAHERKNTNVSRCSRIKHAKKFKNPPDNDTIFHIHLERKSSAANDARQTFRGLQVGTYNRRARLCTPSMYIIPRARVCRHYNSITYTRVARAPPRSSRAHIAVSRQMPGNCAWKTGWVCRESERGLGYFNGCIAGEAAASAKHRNFVCAWRGNAKARFAARRLCASRTSIFKRVYTLGDNAFFTPRCRLMWSLMCGLSFNRNIRIFYAKLRSYRGYETTGNLIFW